MKNIMIKQLINLNLLDLGQDFKYSNSLLMMESKSSYKFLQEKV